MNIYNCDNIYKRFATSKKHFCRLLDGQEYQYDLCSSNRHAYQDMKNLEYLGFGRVTTIDGVVQTGSFSDNLHYWRKIKETPNDA